jgi:hypothetical protein
VAISKSPPPLDLVNRSLHQLRRCLERVSRDPIWGGPEWSAISLDPTLGRATALIVKKRDEAGVPCRFSTEVMRGAGITVTLPTLGTIRTHKLIVAPSLSRPDRGRVATFGDHQGTTA